MKRSILISIFIFFMCFFAASIAVFLGSDKILLSGSTASEIQNLKHESEQRFSVDTGEIVKCSPQIHRKGETLRVTFAEQIPHRGKYLAILRLADNRWFFLYDGTNNFPVWQTEDVPFLSEIRVDPESAVNSTNSENEKIFRLPGKYRVMIGAEDFGQDDPPITGLCEVYLSPSAITYAASGNRRK